MEPGRNHPLGHCDTCPPAALWSGFLRGDVDHPTLEFLSQHLSDCTGCLDLVETLASRSRNGERTVVRSPYLDEQHCKQLLQRASCLRLMEDAASDAAADRIRSRVVEPLPEQLGRYHVRALLGSGGFGRVYLADDPLLQRSVAIKVPRRGLFGTIGEISDFLNEARHAAALDHPGIVPIFDVLEDDAGHALIVMKYIEGRTLSAIRREGPLSLVQAASLMLPIARAVDFAHQQGFVHRDLKPSNILIDTKGQPHVTDFGLGIELGRTSREEIGRGGTPTYMAPEQVRHDVAAIGPATDVWALGVMLADLLTSRSPFQADTREEQFDRILNSSPDLTTIEDVSLQQILQRCLVKDSRERTESALKLAEQLEAWLHRHRLVAGTWSLRTKLLSLCAIVVVGLLVSAMPWFPPWSDSSKIELATAPTTGQDTALSDRSEQPDSATQNSAATTESESSADARVLRESADRVAHDARVSLYAVNMKQAFAAAAAGDMPQVRSLLAKLKPEAGQEDVRGFEWHYLNGHFQPPHQTVDYKVWSALSVRVAPDGQTIAAGGSFFLKLLDAETLVTRRTLGPMVEEFRGLAFSRDGTKLAGTGHYGNVMLWSLPDGKVIHQVKAFQETGWNVEFTPDGDQLAACSSDGVIKVWKIKERELELRHTLGDNEGQIWSMALSPDGKRIAGGTGAPTSIVLWDLETGQRLGAWPCPQRIRTMQFTRDSRRLLAYVGSERAVILEVHDPNQIQAIWQHVRGDGARCVRFAPDETQIAIAGERGDLQVVQVPSAASPSTVAAQPRTWIGHEVHVMSVDYLPDGNRLVSSGDDGIVHLWDLAATKNIPVTVGPNAPRAATWVPPEWQLDSPGQPPSTLIAETGRTAVNEHCVEFDPSGTQTIQLPPEIFSGLTDATIELWMKTTTTGTLLTAKRNGQRTFAMELVPDQKLRLFAENSGTYFVDVSLPQPLNDGQWHHLAIVRHAKLKVFEVVIDGSSIGRSDRIELPRMDSDNVLLGQDSTGKPQDAFKGCLDELRIWSRIRTGHEISDTRFANLGPKTAGLIANYTFENVADGRCADLIQPNNSQRAAVFGFQSLNSPALIAGSLIFPADPAGVYARRTASDDLVRIAAVEPEISPTGLGYRDVQAAASGRVVLYRTDGVIEWFDRVAGSETIPVRHKVAKVLDGLNLSLSPDGRRLAVPRYQDGVIDVHDLDGTNGVQSHPQPSPMNTVFLRDGRRLLSTSAGKLRMWDIDENRLAYEFTAHKTGSVWGLALNPQETVIASGGNDRDVVLSNVADGRPIRTLSRHAATVCGIAFSPDGRSLVSADEHNKLFIWNVETGEFLGELPATSPPATSLRFSTDGHWLWLRNSNNEVRLLRLQ